MTPFAQLSQPAELEKSAWNPMGLLRKLDPLVRNGIWKTIGSRTAATDTGLKGLAHSTSRLFYNPIKDKSTMLAKGLMGYGFGGMGASMMGYDMPGSNLAFNVTMPGLRALFAAPSVVTSMRANSDHNRQRLKDDVMQGSRSAAGDLITLAQQDPRFATQKGLYSQYLGYTNPELGQMASQYGSGRYKPMSRWHQWSSMFEDPQQLIDNRVDREIYGRLNKSGMEKAAMTAIKAGLGKAFPWVFPALGAGMLGHAIFRDKPYDETRAQSQGYAAAASKMQKELDQMGGFKRFMVGLDPSLMANTIDKQLPGTIAQWQRTHGQAYRPGFFGRMAGMPSGPGTNPDANVNYFQTDAAGARHYL